VSELTLDSKSLPLRLGRRGARHAGRPRLWGLLPMIALLILSSALVACYPVRSMPDVIGLYELKVGNDRISLDVSSDQSFTETIRWASGKVEQRTGKWYWNRSSVAFDRLWIPKSFAPDYIEAADAKSGSNQPKYTDPGNWSVSAEKHWGRVTLAVFPDADIYFRMVGHSSR